MERRRGVFQIIHNDLLNSNKTYNAGTAFAIQTASKNENEYYLLTAYHCIAECKDRTVIIKDSNNDSIPCKIIYPEETVMYDAIKEVSDYAVLKFEFPLCSYERYRISCDYNDKEGIVFGSSDHYISKTLFTPFKVQAIMTSPSSINPKTELLVMDISTKDIWDNNSITQRDIIGGISGSPIIIKENDNEIVIGVFNRLFDKNASKAYGVPIKTIANDYLCPNGLFNNLDKIEHIPSIDSDDNDICGYIDLLFDDIDQFSLEDCNQESKLWNRISNSFYSGYTIDKTLSRFISLDVFNSYSIDIQISIRYCFAKLLFKRNKKNEAMCQLESINSILNKTTQTISSRMQALINARKTIESIIKNPQEELDLLRQSGENIMSLKYTDEIYNANEVASVIGKGLLNLFGNLEKTDYNSSINNAIDELMCHHSKLLNAYPNELKKQDVVNTSLRWLSNLWGTKNKTDVTELLHDVNIGFLQSKNRKNSIFYIQALITYAITFLLQEKKIKALRLFYIVFLLMKKENITIAHEGVNQLFHFIKCEYPQMYMLIYLFYTSECDINIFTKKSSYIVNEFSDSALLTSYDLSNSIFNNYCNKRSIYQIDNLEIMQQL